MRASPETRTDPDIEQKKAEIMVPFHKLTQWLAYSLIVPLQTYLEMTIEGLEDMTGLPEYRNGTFSKRFFELYRGSDELSLDRRFVCGLLRT